MEECESLCSKLAIMVNGKFKCIGSQQHLKNKFNKGFKLLTKLRDKQIVAELEEFLKSRLGSVEMTEEYATTLQWAVMEDEPLAKIFAVVEEAKQRFDLVDYSVSQTTLEQVFINFAQSQVICRGVVTYWGKCEGNHDRTHSHFCAFACCAG